MIPHLELLASFIGGPILGLVEWFLFTLLLGTITSVPDLVSTVLLIVFAILGIFQVAWALEKWRPSHRETEDR